MGIKFSTVPMQYQQTVRSKIQNLRENSFRERRRCHEKNITPVVANVWDKIIAHVEADISADDLGDKSIDYMISTEIIDCMDDDMCAAFGR